MAASVLLTLGEQPKLIALIVAKAATLFPGQEVGCVGPVIDAAAVVRIQAAVDAAEAAGAKVS